MPTALDIVTDALLELGVLNASDVASGDDAAFGLRKLNRLLDRWNAQRAAVYTSSLASYTLTPNLQPHTIGPAGTFNVAQRPVTIEGANLVLDNVSPNVRVPITLRDLAWWRRVSVQGTTSTVPTDLYYEPGWALGKIYLWPVPTTAYKLELQTRTVLASLALTDTFALPPGYQDAITKTLAEELSSAFRIGIPQTLAEGAREARAVAFDNNDVTPRLVTRDHGLPSSQGHVPPNYHTRGM